MRVTLLAGFIATVGVLACGGDDADPDPVDPAVEAATVGTYTLTLVNGAALPFKYGQSDTSRFDLVSGQIVLEADKDMTDEQTTEETRLSNGQPIGVEATQRFIGSWSISRDSVRLLYPGLGVQMAWREGSVLTLSDGVLTLTYNK
jgi:hypothetical protein